MLWIRFGSRNKPDMSICGYFKYILKSILFSWVPWKCKEQLEPGSFNPGMFVFFIHCSFSFSGIVMIFVVFIWVISSFNADEELLFYWEVQFLCAATRCRACSCVFCTLCALANRRKYIDPLSLYRVSLEMSQSELQSERLQMNVD